MFTLVFITGHAYNSIRNVPFAGRESIAPGFQTQYGLETRLMALLYGTGTLGIILLSVHVPTISNDTTRRALAYIYSAMFLASVTAVVGVFRIKYGGYPFSPFFFL